MYKYWGKYAEKTGEVHLAVYHCLDVSLMFKYTITHSKSWARAVTAGYTLPFDKVLRQGMLGCAMHDLGKLSVPFQLKKKLLNIATIINPSWIGVTCENQNKYYHGEQVIRFCNEEISSYTNGAIDEVEHLGRKTELSKFLLGIGGHHGVDVNLELSETKNNISRNLKDFHEINSSSALDCDREARIEYMTWCFKNIMKEDIEFIELPEAYYGLLSICDWLASTEGMLNYSSMSMPLENYCKQAWPSIVTAVQNSGIMSRKVKAKDWREIYPQFKKQNPIQKKANKISLDSKSSLVIVESGTGSGKSETALHMAARMLHGAMEEGNLIFASPTIATADAMFLRIKKDAVKIFGSGVSVSLANSKVKSNEDYTKHKQGSGIYDVSGRPQSICDKWLQHNKMMSIISNVCVCTVDYVMNAMFGTKHRNVKLSQLAKCVLVIDEVHSYDDYMTTIIKEVVRFIINNGGSVILLSATMSDAQKQEFIEVVNPSKCKLLGPVKGSKKICRDKRYPLVTVVDENKYRSYKVKVGKGDYDNKTVRFKTEYSPDCMPSDKVLKDALDRSRRGQKVVFMMNVVSDAQKVYNSIMMKADKDDVVVLSHSKFTIGHRKKNDKRIMEIADNSDETSYNKNGCIVIATQVIEQSLDLDFDYAVIQICPIDSLFQRIGRLWRRIVKRRIAEMGTAECLILMPNDIDNAKMYGKSIFVYENAGAMWRTAKLIEKKKNKKISFPKAYRTWMAMIYNPSYRLKRLPVTIKEKQDKYDKSVSQAKKVASGRMGMKTSEVFMSGNNNIETLTRDLVLKREIHLIEQVGDKFFCLANGKEIIHPEKSSLPEKEALDEYHNILELCSISLYEYEVQNLFLERESKLFEVTPAKYEKGFALVTKLTSEYIIRGVKNDYLYDNKVGFRKF